MRLHEQKIKKSEKESLKLIKEVPFVEFIFNFLFILHKRKRSKDVKKNIKSYNAHGIFEGLNTNTHERCEEERERKIFSGRNLEIPSNNKVKTSIENWV